MPTPSHGADCLSKTYDTKCRYCSNQIVVYQCNHDSVVLFDGRGNGWPQHSCSGMLPEMWRYPYLGEAAPQVDASKIGMLREREVQRTQRRLKPSSVPFQTIDAVEHIHETRETVMIVRELPSVAARVTSLDRLGSFVRAAMGIDANSSASKTKAQLCLQDTNAEPRGIYNAIVDLEQLAGLMLERNIALGVRLESRGFGNIAEWFVNDIAVIETSPESNRGNTSTKSGTIQRATVR